jgi:lysine-N-methylase
MTLSYMTRFSCIGGRCENTCCRGWAIHIDEQTYRDLERALGAPADQALFAQSVELLPASLSRVSNDAAYARIKHLPDGNCPFLDAQGLCSIQSRFGEELLPRICREYPRVYRMVEGRSELAANLSCPEAARQCLLEPDATELVLALDSSAHPVPPETATPSDGYRREYRVVRDAAHQLLGNVAGLPVASRFFTLARYASRLAPFHRRGVAPPDPALLARETSRALDHAHQLELHHRFAELEVGASPLAVELVREIVAVGLTLHGNPYSYAIASKVLDSYHRLDEAEAARTAGWSARPDYERMRLLYSGRLQALRSSPLAARLEQYWLNYARNFLVKEPFVEQPSLLASALVLLARLAVLRFLLLGHPDTVDLGAAVGESQERLDRAAVDVFSCFSRAILHSTAMMRSVDAILDGLHVDSLACAAILIKF